MNATAERVQPKAQRGPDRGPRHPPLPLAKALSYAAKIAEWIAPHCRQIEPVGEIRRLCPKCKAVELLVVPRFEANTNLLYSFLDDYVQNHAQYAALWRHPGGRNDLTGVRPASHDQTAALSLPKCWLVIYTAETENWFMRLFETTGPAAHVATIVQRVNSLPGIWQPSDCIRVRNKTIRPQCEGHIYDVLNMSMVVPWRRVA